MKKRTIALGLGLPLALLSGCADDKNDPNPATADGALTYWKDMAPMFAEHCNGCHQPGGIAPFRLDSYATAKQKASEIRAATESRIMPPWSATSDGTCGEFSGNLALSDDEIASIGRWVEGGAQEGTATMIEQPVPPTLKDATVYTTPEFLPEAQGGALAAHDEYRCFMLDPQVDEQAFITGYTVEPGAAEIVHHVLVMMVDGAAPADEPSRSNLEQMQALDAESPDRDGWPCFANAGEHVNVDSVPVVWAPGQGVVQYPNQSGVPISEHHKVIVQIHYNLAEKQGLTDQTRVKLRIQPDVENVGLFTLPDPFLASISRENPDVLEPSQRSVKYTWQRSMQQLGFDGLPNAKLYGVMPHMHQLGHKYRMNLIDGDSTQRCGVDVQNWDFHWQRFYFYEQPLPLKSDTSIEVTCDFDTSSRTEPVLPGWGTQNEMCLATLFITVPLADLGSN